MPVTPTGSKRPVEITDKNIQNICERLAANKPVRRNLPGWGRVHVDRSLPFLCVYRRPRGSSDEGTDRLVTTEASYLTATSVAKHQKGVSNLVCGIANTMGELFGTFLVLEIWAGRVAPSISVGADVEGAEDSQQTKFPGNTDSVPGFRIFIAPDKELDSLADFLETALHRVRLMRRRAEVTIVRSRRSQAPRMSPVIDPSLVRKGNYIVAGIEVRPVYRDPAGEHLYPLRLRPFRRQMSLALKRSLFEFSRHYTTHRPKHYHMLGRRAVAKAVWEVDSRFGDVSDQFDLLLQTTPINARQAWNAFRRAHFEKPPVFKYRPVPVDPSMLKRSLFSAPIERVEDPALAFILRQKQNELDRQITMLLDLNTKRFVHGSFQLYGGVGDNLMKTAVEILERLPSRTREDAGSGLLDAHAFARRAKEEIAWYRQRWPDVKAAVHVRDDINSGLLVSSGSLLIGSQSQIPVSRVEALLQHEVGTHVLTYYNGKAQPLRLMYSGLAGYEALQEGLAVLAEYFVGGLSRPRVRLLAARVLAVRMMIDGATFTDCFRKLNSEFGLAQHSAFTVTMRVYRGGGFTKDAIYLRGLDQLLEYMNDGGALHPLFVGKIATEHVPIIEELMWRRVLRDAPLSPRYMDKPETSARLDRVRGYESVSKFVREEYK